MNERVAQQAHQGGRIDRRKTFGQVNGGGIKTEKSQREGNREG